MRYETSCDSLNDFYVLNILINACMQIINQLFKFANIVSDMQRFLCWCNNTIPKRKDKILLAFPTL